MASAPPDPNSTWNFFLQVFLLALGGLAAIGAWVKGNKAKAPIVADEMLRRDLMQTLEASSHGLSIRIDSFEFNSRTAITSFETRLREQENFTGRLEERIKSLEE